jgi:hypothetical protein
MRNLTVIMHNRGTNVSEACEQSNMKFIRFNHFTFHIFVINTTSQSQFAIWEDEPV